MSGTKHASPLSGWMLAMAVGGVFVVIVGGLILAHWNTPIGAFLVMSGSITAVGGLAAAIGIKITERLSR
jgi:hypothetical protein